VVAFAAASVLGATHIHVAHAEHGATLTDAGRSDGPFIGRDCPVCALAHVPAIAGDAPISLAPRDVRVGGAIEKIPARASLARTLRPSRGPPSTC
jgi:hypothetical protein